jgi:Dna[CI] antecedent DciA-like protein
MPNSSHRPRSLSEILSEMFTVRGYSRLWARQELENAWNTAVGEPYCRQTRVGEVRHAVLIVTVAHSALLDELVAFRKAALLASLKWGAPGTAIHDIRFRFGSVAIEIEPASKSALPLLTAAVPVHFDPPVPRQRAQLGIKSNSRCGYGPDPQSHGPQDQSPSAVT